MKKAIFGYGGHAREVIHFLNEDVDIFVDDEYSGGLLNPVSKFDPDIYEMMICVGESELRKRVRDGLPKNTKYFSFVHPTSIVSDDITIGEGTYIGPYCILTVNIALGSHCLFNRGVQIGHDSKIGDFFSAMPGSVVSGNCNIGDCVYLGSNSSVREKISICDNTIIGLSSGVVKNIETTGTYVGVPAKKIIK
jgi:sugar O-acyltransferase (sialic acid O-acetyltransferase NeuD family)